MTTKFLSKAVAAAAFGGASLLIAAPGIALAGDGGDHDRDHRKDGWVYAWPGTTSPGGTVTIVEICKKPQEKPWVWSEATGKLWLEPRTDSADEDEAGDSKDKRKDHKNHKDRKDHKDHKDHKDRKGDKRFKSEEADENEGRFEREDRKGFDDKRHHKFRFEENTFEGSASLDEMTAYEQMAVYRDGPRDHDRKGKDHHDKWDRHDRKGDDHKGKDRDGRKHHRDADKKHKKHPWAYFAEAEISSEIEPGVYELKGSCGDGKLIVTPVGSVDAGSGTMTSADSSLLAGGAGMVAAAVLAGTALLRRRTADEFIA